MGKNGTHFTELNNESTKQQQKSDSSGFALCTDVMTTAHSASDIDHVHV